MIVDFHTHILPDELRAGRARYLARDRWFAEQYSAPNARLASADDLIASMDAAGIDLSVTFGFGWFDQGLCRASNDYVIEAMNRFPGRLLGLACVQPLSGATALEEVERCLAAGMRGVGELFPYAQAFDLLDEAVMGPLVELLVAHRALLLLHASEPVGHRYPGKGTATPDRLFEFLTRYPELRLVLAHWGGGLSLYELMPSVAAVTRNVYYDTAASTYLYRFDIFPVAARILGKERILMASDYPLLRQDRFLERVRGAGLSAGELDAIAGGNAARLLDLAPSAAGGGV